MYGRQDNSENSQPPPWLVRAEVTIRHGTPVTSNTGQIPVGASSTVTDSNGVRMTYRWNTSNQPVKLSSDSLPTTSTSSNSYGFQRGNILFTSTPPARSTPPSTSTIPRLGSWYNDVPGLARGQGTNISDSGYNSGQFSPLSYSSLPSRRPSQQYNRRCKSTCNIVLSAVGDNNNYKNVSSEKSQYETSNTKGKDSSKFSSIDPWHHRTHQHAPIRYHFSTVPEVCEDCAEGSTSSAFTTHFCTRVPEKTANKTIAISKDASSQTTDVESRSSSLKAIKNNRTRRKAGIQVVNEAKNTEQEDETPGASIGTVNTVSLTEPDKSDSSTKDDSVKRKSRTVHIDVYCTGTDDDCSTDSSTEDERETEMTVFENEDVKVTHTEVTNSNLPKGFQDKKAFLKRAAERRCESFKNAPMRMPSLASSKGYDSDDVLSSLYPSQFSSYSTLADFDSAPWSTTSSTVAAPLENYDSTTTATSSKDTISNVESLVNSVPSLVSCDSFDYAKSPDYEKIDRMDTIWGKSGKEKKRKNWRSPQIERKHLLRNRKMREYLENHDIGWSSDDSIAESDESGAIGWTFISNDNNPDDSKKDSIICRASKNKIEAVENISPNVIHTVTEQKRLDDNHSDSTTRSDFIPHPYTFRDQIGPFGSNSPSPLLSKVSSRVTSPFTTPQGEKTDHITKASIFGSVVNAFRKPGHHIGPSKNPSCSCEHCRRYFEECNTQGRSRSPNNL